MTVTVTLVFDSMQTQMKYDYRQIINLVELYEHLSRNPEIGYGRFYRVKPDGTTYFVPFNEYSEWYIDHSDSLYYEVYNEDTQSQLVRLCIAIQTGDLVTTRELVPTIFNVNSIVPRDGSLLHQAIAYDQVQIVEYLLQQGADVNLNDGRFLPLSVATHGKNLPIVQLLVENGANVNGMASYGLTFIGEAIAHSSPSIVNYLLKVGADFECADQIWRPIHIAVDSNNLEIVKMLVEAGANINKRIMDTNWNVSFLMTPIMLAARKGYSDIVQYLLELGASTDKCNIDGLTAEDIARDHGYVDIADRIRDFNEELIKEPEL